LQRSAGIETGPGTTGESIAEQRRGLSRRPIPSDEFGPVARKRAGLAGCAEERNPIAELRVVGVGREQRAGVGVHTRRHEPSFA
jgi:hypothetical protein